MNRHLLHAFVILALAISGRSASAATITLTATHPSGESWLTTSKWSNGALPSAGNDYVVGTGLLGRSPASADPLFAGDSLTINGELRMKHTGTMTVSNLILNGTLNAGNDVPNPNTQIVAGGINVTGNSLLTGDTVGRVMQLNSLVAGSAALTMVDPAGGGTLTVRFTNAANTYNGLITVQADTTLDFDYNANHGQTINILTGGKLTLDQNLSFASGGFKINGSALANGTYDMAALTTMGHAAFFNTGAGTISVVPEPATWSLAVVGLGLLAAYRRRIAR